MSYFGTIYADTELPSRAKTVYMYLRDRSDAEGKCWSGINTIASDMKLSRSTLKRALHDLEQHGYLEKTPRHLSNGSSTSNLYTIRSGRKKRSSPPRGSCAHLLDPGVVHGGPPRRTHSN